MDSGQWTVDCVCVWTVEHQADGRRPLRVFFIRHCCCCCCCTLCTAINPFNKHHFWFCQPFFKPFLMHWSAARVRDTEREQLRRANRTNRGSCSSPTGAVTHEAGREVIRGGVDGGIRSCQLNQLNAIYTNSNRTAVSLNCSAGRSQENKVACSTWKNAWRVTPHTPPPTPPLDHRLYARFNANFMDKSNRQMIN